MLTIGDDVGVLFTWFMCISKHGNACKNQKKEGKKNMVLIAVDNVGVFFTWFVHIFKYGNLQKNSQRIKKKKIKDDTLICYDIGGSFQGPVHFPTFPGVESDAIHHQNVPRS